MEILGYFGAILIGVSLGLIGGGGSILTVPVLVYFFSVSPVLATAYSLFIVGISSLFGALGNIKKGNVNFMIAAIFAIPSLTAVFLTRRYIITSIPEELFTWSEFTLTKDVAIMAFFALIMLAAAYSMIKDNKSELKVEEKSVKKLNYPLIFLEGAIVGFVTGLVGAGGGFLIIPALVLLVGLPMKKAVGTSLIIIAVKSILGFTGDLLANQSIDWNFLIVFTAIAVVGIAIGLFISKWISGSKLKVGFGYFVLIMAIFILGKELI